MHRILRRLAGSSRFSPSTWRPSQPRAGSFAQIAAIDTRLSTRFKADVELQIPCASPPPLLPIGDRRI